MELVLRIMLGMAILGGFVLLYLSMHVLHTFEVETKKRPPSIQFWPFNAEIKARYPGLAKTGRVLQIFVLSISVLYGLGLLVSE